MRARHLTLVLTLFVAPCLFAQDDVQFFPLSEIRPGLKGVGRTVFEGDKVEEFQVEILGVMKNVLAPKHDVILGRLSGGPLEKTGVIAGMSGSPVYVDGKLVGAVALAFPFSKEALTGITPIAEILSVVPDAAADTPAERRAELLTPRVSRVSGGSLEDGRLIPEESEDGLDLWKKFIPATSPAGSLAALRLPARFGGFASHVVETYAPLFRGMGFEPMLSSSLAASADESAAPRKIEPGSMISLHLVRGDLNLNIDCTVTYIRKDSLYACGHRVLFMGPSKIPFAPTRVLAVVPSLASSFKLNVPGPLVGNIRQDRFGAIYGEVGDRPELIPIRVRVDSTLNRQIKYRFEIVQENFLSPLLMNISLISSLTATERMLGPSTFEIKGTIRLSSGEAVDVEDVVSGDANTGALAGMTMAAPLSYLLGSAFPNLRVDEIDVSIVSRSEKRVATLEQVWSTKSEVRPGDRIEVTALLRTPGGETVTQKIPVQIPESVSDKTLSLVVGSGGSINFLQNRVSPLATTPRDLRQLVRALNRIRRNNRLYALLMAPQRSFILQGDEYPSPPPSLVQTFMADPAVSSSMTLSNTSVIGDFETRPSPYTIRGQKTLILKVVNWESR